MKNSYPCWSLAGKWHEFNRELELNSLNICGSSGIYKLKLKLSHDQTSGGHGVQDRYLRVIPQKKWQSQLQRVNSISILAEKRLRVIMLQPVRGALIICSMHGVEWRPHRSECVSPFQVFLVVAGFSSLGNQWDLCEPSRRVHSQIQVCDTHWALCCIFTASLRETDFVPHVSTYRPMYCISKAYRLEVSIGIQNQGWWSASRRSIG